MNRRLVPALVLLSVLLAAFAAAEPCSPEVGGAKSCEERALPGAAVARPHPDPSPPPALGVPAPAPAPLGEGAPSLLGALARLLGAVIVIALLMTGAVLGYRRLVQRAGTRTGVLAWATGWSEDHGADAVRVTSRRHLGGRESVAVIHAGGERFLVGITAAQVSLLAHLESPATEPVPDFTEALVRATAPHPPVTESPSAADQLRAAVERSRERLGRLAHLSVVPRDGRG
jgi:flagellar biogenesis protein FliO